MLQKHSEAFRDPNMLNDTKNVVGRALCIQFKLLKKTT